MYEKFVNIYELKARFSAYAREVLKGRTFILAIRNKPFAELRPLSRNTPAKIVFGVLKGKFEMPANFNAPLEEFEQAYYGK